jgi:hypothetical protein
MARVLYSQLISLQQRSNMQHPIAAQSAYTPPPRSAPRLQLPPPPPVLLPLLTVQAPSHPVFDSQAAIVCC